MEELFKLVLGGSIGIWAANFCDKAFIKPFNSFARTLCYHYVFFIIHDIHSKKF